MEETIKELIEDFLQSKDTLFATEGALDALKNLFRVAQGVEHWTHGDIKSYYNQMFNSY